MPHFYRTMLATLALALTTMSIGLPAKATAIDQLQTTDDIGINKVPNQGTSHVLVIPVRAIEPIPDYKWAELQEVYNPAGGPGTFREFYQRQSRGTYDPIPTLLEPLVYETCPVPSLDPVECRLDLSDIAPLINGEVTAVAEDILRRVRDERGIDLRDFDINGLDCPADQECPDGFLDGLVFDTNLFGGIAFPFAALNNAITIKALPQPLSDGGVVLDGGDASTDAGPADDEPTITVGIVALVPPYLHEFAHNLGFIDHYNSRFNEADMSTCTGLMAREGRGLSAFSRLAIGWGESELITGAGVHQLAPVLDGGKILRLGGAEKYLLIENRSGALHSDNDIVAPGIYIYHVDERQLPDPNDPLGFIDLLSGELYYPNLNAPYLNVNIPFSCSINSPERINACDLQPGDKRNLTHLTDGHLGYYISVDSVAADGTAQIEIIEGLREDAIVMDAGPGEPEPQPEPEGQPEPAVEPETEPGPCGCGSSGMASAPLFGFGLLLLACRRRRVRR